MQFLQVKQTLKSPVCVLTIWFLVLVIIFVIYFLIAQNNKTFIMNMPFISLLTSGIHENVYMNNNCFVSRYGQNCSFFSYLKPFTLQSLKRDWDTVWNLVYKLIWL